MDRDIDQHASARVPFATVVVSIAGLWVCYFLLTTLRAEVLDLPFSGEMMWRRALACLAGICITLGLWLILRLFDARPLWTKIVAAVILSMPVAISIAYVNDLIMEDLHAKIEAEYRAGNRAGLSPSGADVLIDIPGMAAPLGGSATGDAKVVRVSSWQEITDVVFGRYFMMLAWCALYLALLTGQEARAAERREGAFRRAAKAAELRSLRYQVNPHFLFNTLNSLSALVLTNRTDAAEKMIQTLSAFYRRSLADDPTADVPVREEFALQKMYLEIEAVRFPKRLRAEYRLPAELEDARIPGMILQPLVENSVRHAVAPSSGRVTITLAARIEYGRLVLTVSDNGIAHTQGEHSRAGFGIGLANVRERLEARFGSDATVVSGLVDGGYATVLRLPILNGEGER